MNKVIVRAPVRADLAGGTLDLWPLYLFHPGARTVNVAISFFAESEVCETGNGGIEIHLTDDGYKRRYESVQEMAGDPKVALLHRSLEHFRLTGISITTRTDAPRGSGLGGSSALSVTLVRALSELAGDPVEGESLVTLVRDLETRLLGLPAGIQDYYPPVFGGLAALHLNPGRPERHAIGLSPQLLGAHMLLHHSGVAHFSGTNNWELYRRHVEGDARVRDGLAHISVAAAEMERALEAGNLQAAGNALLSEWKHRKAMIDGISTPEVDAAIEAGLGAGAWGGKVCGAGGGGGIVFLLPQDRREAVLEALSQVPGRTLDAVPVAHGMTVERDRTAAGSSGSRPRMVTRRPVDGVEEMYVAGGTGDYRPYILAEAIVTHRESRSGFHHATARSYVAPLAGADGQAIWQQASLVDIDALDLRATPEEKRAIGERDRERVIQTATQLEESFRQFLVENERMELFHNPAFGFYSEPAETRQAFLERCRDEARRQLEDEQERLESTYRRRFDQLRERSEREQREIEKQDQVSDAEKQEINVAWGQALYNLTSGRPAAVTDATPTVREVDYLDTIAQIQKNWDRELDRLREELNAKAEAIEQIAIVPTARNIEVTKFLVLWSASMP